MVTAMMGFIYGIFSGYIYDISLVAVGFLSVFVVLNFVISLAVMVISFPLKLLFKRISFPEFYIINSWVFMLFALFFFGLIKIFELEIY